MEWIKVEDKLPSFHYKKRAPTLLGNVVALTHILAFSIYLYMQFIF